MSEQGTSSDQFVSVREPATVAENLLEQLSQAVAASRAPDPEWSPGNVLNYRRNFVQRGRGRPRGSAGLGIVAVCIGVIAAAACLLLGIVELIDPANRIPESFIGWALLLVGAGAIVGTTARRYHASRRLGTIGRWIAIASPVLLLLPEAVFSLFTGERWGSLAILFSLGIVEAGVVLFCTLVLDAIFGAE